MNDYKVLLMFPQLYTGRIKELHAIKTICERANIGFGGGTCGNGDEFLQVMLHPQLYSKTKTLFMESGGADVSMDCVLSIIPNHITPTRPPLIVTGGIEFDDSVPSIAVVGKRITKDTHSNFDEILKRTKALIRKREQHDRELDMFAEELGGVNRGIQ